jgi:hypothetical protein
LKLRGDVLTAITRSRLNGRC